MRPASAAFREAIGRSHAIARRIEVLSAGAVVATLDAVDTLRGGPITGEVTLDNTAQTRGRLALTIADSLGPAGTLLPVSPRSLLAPYGNELRVSRGIAFPNGTIELVSLGVFRVEDAEVSDDGVQIAGLDRSARVIDARFEEPYQVAAGTNTEAAIAAVLGEALPGVLTVFPGASYTTPLLFGEEGGDRWQFAQDLALSIGMTLYFNGDGAAVLSPALPQAPTAQLVEGDGGVLLTAGRNWKRTGTFNRVIVTGDNTGDGPPVRGVATDSNPESPTYYLGSFGKVPRFYASSFIRTDEQAQQAAQSILDRELGTTQRVTFGSVVDPTLEPGDVARITRAALGIDEDHVVDTLTIPLEASVAASGATRARPVFG